MVARVGVCLYVSPNELGGNAFSFTTSATTSGNGHDACTDAEHGEGGGFGDSRDHSVVNEHEILKPAR